MYHYDNNIPEQDQGAKLPQYSKSGIRSEHHISTRLSCRRNIIRWDNLEIALTNIPQSNDIVQRLAPKHMLKSLNQAVKPLPLWVLF